METVTSTTTVSIVIATLNRPHSLRECLSSLEEQTVSPLEVIVVVDGELTEQVQQVMDHYKSNSKLNLLQINNCQRKGATFSKNLGAAASSGDIVAFVDDDVTLVPDWVEQVIQGYSKNRAAVGVGGRVVMRQLLFNSAWYRLFVKIRQYLFGAKLGKLNFVGMPYLSLTLPCDNGRHYEVDFLHGGNMTFRREIVTACRLDEAMGVRDEFDLCVRASRYNGGKLIYNPRAVAYHNHTEIGGIGLWGEERVYRDLRDHTVYLMKNFRFKYLRLFVLFFPVFGYSIVTMKPKYVKAIPEGIMRYRLLVKGNNRSRQVDIVPVVRR